MTKIAPKKWLLVFIYSLGLIIFLIGSLNYYIDSSSFFSNNISSKYYFLDNNTFKTNYIIKNFKNKNINLILGSSRLQNINNKIFKKEGINLDFYNYSNPGGTPLHHYHNLKYLIKNGIKIKKIIIGIDYFSFVHIGNTKSYPFSIYPIDYQDFNKITLSLYYLFSLNLLKQNLKSLFNKINNKQPANRIFDDGSVVNFKNSKLKLSSSSHKLVDIKHENFSKTDILNSQKQAFKKLINLINTNNIELSIIIPPPSYIVLKYQHIETKLDIIKFILENTKKPLIDFSYFNEITLLDSNFYDISHMNYAVSKSVINELLLKHKIGLVVNVINFEDYSQFIRENFKYFQNKLN